MSRQVRSVSTETCAIAKLGRYIPVATSKIYRAFIKVLQFEIAFNTTGSLHQTAGACRPSRCPLLALSGSMDGWSTNATATPLRRVQYLSRPTIKNCSVSGRCRGKYFSANLVSLAPDYSVSCLCIGETQSEHATLLKFCPGVNSYSTIRHLRN
jgi:hypothetical protein